MARKYIEETTTRWCFQHKKEQKNNTIQTQEGFFYVEKKTQMKTRHRRLSAKRPTSSAIVMSSAWKRRLLWWSVDWKSNKKWLGIRGIRDEINLLSKIPMVNTSPQVGSAPFRFRDFSPFLLKALSPFWVCCSEYTLWKVARPISEKCRPEARPSVMSWRSFTVGV